MAADDRPGPVSGLSSSPKSPVRAEGQYSATFEIVGWRVELSASAAVARLVILGDGTRLSHVIECGALDAWAAATTKLLSLRPAENARGRAAIRAPFLVDREGEASIAFEATVSEQGLGFRLLIRGGEDPLASLVTTEDIVRGVAQAAAGIARVARPTG